MLSIFSTFYRMFGERKNDDKGSKHDLKGVKFLPGGSRAEVKVEAASANDNIGHKSLLRNCQIRHVFRVQWHAYLPLCVNLICFFEVVGFFCITGVFPKALEGKAVETRSIRYFLCCYF